MTRVIARGKIRVDARRAVSKLREHLLLDLDLYLIEIVRAAVAAGCRSLGVSWDADDVRLGFECPELPAERLARLLDHLTGDGGERHYRLLALGVNAALGTVPEHVDLSSVSSGRALRVRFTPEVVETGHPRVEAAALPEGAPATGLVVHVRKRLGWDVVRRVVGRAGHREIELLAEAHREGAPELILAGRRFEPPAPVALARRVFDVPGARRAMVEILHSGETGTFELCELGFLLSSPSWAPVIGVSELPARLTLDALELPTNASRSAVREESRIVQDALRDGTRAFFDAASAIAARTLGSEPPAGVELSDAPHEAFEDALGDIVSGLASAARRGHALPAEARALLDLPLLSDAAGNPRAVSEFLAAERIFVVRSDTPLESELAPWLGGVLWLRGTRVERALSAAQLMDAGELLTLARAGAERRARLLAHPPSAPGVPRSEHELVRERFHFTGELEGLNGEVAVLTPDVARSTIRVHVEGRHFDTLSVDASALPLPMDVAVAWHRLRPKFAWDGIEQDAALHQAVGHALLVGVRAIARLGPRLGRIGGGERAALAAVLRAALGALALAPGRFGITPDAATRAAGAEIANLPIWPAADGRWLTSFVLDAYRRRTGAVCFVHPGARVSLRPPDDRPVVIASAAELSLIEAVLGGEVERVPYERALSQVDERAPELAFDDERERAGASSSSAVRRFELGDARGIIAVAAKSSVLELHAGARLGQLPRPALLGDVFVVLDDPRSVPKADWSALCYRPPRFWWKVERELCLAIVAAVSGDEAARKELGPGLCWSPPAPAIRRYLLQAVDRLERRLRGASRAGAQQDDARELLGAIRELPFLTLLDTDGRPRPASLSELARRHSGAVPVLEAEPGFETLDWYPVLLATEPEREAFERVVPECRRAADELVARRQRAEGEGARRRFEQLARLEPRSLPHAEARWPIVVLERPAEGIASVTVGLPRASGPRSAAVDVLLWERPLCTIGALVRTPVAARVALDHRDLVSEYRAVAGGALTIIEGAVERAAWLLVDALVERGELLADARSLDLLSHLADRSPEKVRGAVERTTWLTVQGGEARGSELVKGDQLRFGRQRHPSWIHDDALGAELDRPLLHLADAAIESLLRRAGYRLIDVTSAVDQLQAWRARAADAPAPRFAGAPAHPELRFTLAALGVKGAAGECEVLPAAPSEITLIDLDGVTRGVEASLPVPIRLVARVARIGSDARADKRLLRQVSRAVARRMAALTDAPPFVRAHLGRLLLSRLERGARISKQYEGLCVLVDIAGRWHALRELRAAPRVGYTTAEPPHPERPYELPVLQLDRQQARVLRRQVQLRDMTATLRKDLAAEQRRAAPPRQTVALRPEDRQRCLIVTTIEDDHVEGEVGVLLPHAMRDRGVELCVEKRALCRLQDSGQMPIVAIVNDDRVRPNRFFDAPASSADRDRVLTRVLAAAEEVLARRWSVPSEAHGLRRFDACFSLGKSDFTVAGALWLPDAPTAARVRIHLPTASQPLERTLAGIPVHPLVHATLPLSGEILVYSASPSPELGAELVCHLGRLALLHGAPLARVPGAEVERWMLVLAGADDEPNAPTADGQLVGARAVIAELRRAGRLWVSRGRGSADGAFPGAAPAFVLGADTPLIRALELAAPRVLAELGELPRQSPHEPGGMEIRAAPAATPGLFAELRRRLRPSPQPADASSDALCRLLHAKLAALELDGDPVARVERGRGRRALRYDERRRVLVVGAGDARFRALCQRALRERGALTVLAAAAVSEVNRALTAVTDGEEHRALQALLSGG